MDTEGFASVLPDTASLGRAGLAALQVSLPLLLLVAGLVARKLILRRQGITEGGPDDGPGAGGIGEA